MNLNLFLLHNSVVHGDKTINWCIYINIFGCVFLFKSFCRAFTCHIIKTIVVHHPIDCNNFGHRIMHYPIPKMLTRAQMQNINAVMHDMYHHAPNNQNYNILLRRSLKHPMFACWFNCCWVVKSAFLSPMCRFQTMSDPVTRAYANVLCFAMVLFSDAMKLIVWPHCWCTQCLWRVQYTDLE